jgi:transposase InsO family protein
MPYTGLLKKHNVHISMTQNGDPYENAMAERINGILKQEWKLDQTFASFDHAQQSVDVAIHQYNHYRPHASCDYLTPIQAHQKNGPLPKRWKPKVKEQKTVSMPA